MTSAKSNSLRCAFYGRMSTDEQEHSIESQRMVAESYATANGHIITEEYLDAGIAGDKIFFRDDVPGDAVLQSGENLCITSGGMGH